MFKKILALLCVGLFILSGCKDGPLEVVSDDYKVQMTIDALALPEGISKKDLSISVHPPNETITFNGSRALAAYDLKPNGLTFTKPVTIELELPLTDGKVPSLYHLSDNEFTSIESTEVTLIKGKGLALLKAEIDHFSTIIVSAEKFSTTIEHPSLVLVGQTFDVKGKIDILPRQQIKVNVPGTTNVSSGEITINKPWSVEDKLMADDASPVTPITHQEPRQDVNADNHEYNKSFTCRNPGMIRIRYNPSIKWTEAHTYTGSFLVPKGTTTTLNIPDVPVNHVVMADSDLFECSIFIMALNETMEDALLGEPLMVDVIVLNNEHYPVSQFTQATSEACDGALVYHAEEAVYSLHNEITEDPDPAGCGFGKVEFLPVYTVKVSQKLAESFEGTF